VIFKVFELTDHLLETQSIATALLFWIPALHLALNYAITPLVYAHALDSQNHKALISFDQ
jgi:hypothetical protein